MYRLLLTVLTTAVIALVSVATATTDKPLELTMEEELPKGTKVGDMILDANLRDNYDKDTLGALQFTFLTQPDKCIGCFVIEKTSGIITTGAVIDRDKLCPKDSVCTIEFDIAIRPIEYFKIVKVVVTLRDINDNSPVFPKRRLHFQIAESTLSGTSFAVPVAVDPDHGLNGIQLYKLLPVTQNFGLKLRNMADGSVDLRLILKKELDRERLDFYQLHLIASDGGKPSRSGTMVIDISVSDANDNGPKFENSTYETSVLESAPPGTTILRVRAVDYDEGMNSQIAYDFTEEANEEYSELFGIESVTGAIYLKANLDHEVKSLYLLSVVARDKGPDSQTARASLVIHVQDINDNPPEININTFTANGDAQVIENADINTFVAHISVDDKDSKNNGKVKCALDNNFYFSLRKLYSSEFKLVTSTVFDREKHSTYEVTITCWDHGWQPQSSMAQVVVNILDENDEIPMFVQDQYTVMIEENNVVGAFLLQVDAIDIDADQNGQVSYRLDKTSSDYLEIDDRDGTIRTRAAFDHELIQDLDFPVIAVDHGKPQKTSSVIVHLTILDIDDERPQFTSDSYAFGTFENLEPGIEVGQVTAYDRDSPPNNEFSYFWDTAMGRNRDVFSVHPDTGVITANMRLDREMASAYILCVVAAPDDDPYFSSTASVTIYVTDSNDNPPVFDFPNGENYTVQISSLAPLGYMFSRLRARDLDTGQNAQLTYAIIKGNRDHRFAIDPVTGDLSINSEINTIRREVFYLRVTVTDGGDPPLSSAGELLVIVSQDFPPPALKTHSLLADNNLTVILAVVLATIAVSILIIAAIICILKRKQRTPTGKTETEKVLPSESTETTEKLLADSEQFSFKFITTAHRKPMQNHSQDPEAMPEGDFHIINGQKMKHLNHLSPLQQQIPNGQIRNSNSSIGVGDVGGSTSIDRSHPSQTAISPVTTSAYHPGDPRHTEISIGRVDGQDGGEVDGGLIYDSSGSNSDSGKGHSSEEGDPLKTDSLQRSSTRRICHHCGAVLGLPEDSPCIQCTTVPPITNQIVYVASPANSQPNEARCPRRPEVSRKGPYHRVRFAPHLNFQHNDLQELSEPEYSEPLDSSMHHFRDTSL